jgi:glycosyltransferase involved in cell wall biosynthesis
MDSVFQTGGDQVPDATYRTRSDWHGPARILLDRFRQRVTALMNKAHTRRQPKAFFTDPTLPGATPYRSGLSPETILHLHWVPFLVDMPSFFGGLVPNQPVVWTLHDINPMTGGCHYTQGCDRFTNACGDCPLLDDRGPHDRSHLNLDCKVRTVGRLTNLHLAGDSHWTTGQARRSRVFRSARSVQTVHYGLDTGVFRPGRRGAARRQLGLADDAFVICAGSYNLGERRKGGHVLRKALLEEAGLRDAVLLIFGGEAGPFEGLPQRVVAAGLTHDESMLAEIYCAADVFAMPSLEEAFGQTALEAMACGVPVVGSDVGGIPDMVEPEITGLLVPPGDSAALGEAMVRLKADAARRASMGAAARQKAEAHFGLARQVRDYLRIYQTALEFARS